MSTGFDTGCRCKRCYEGRPHDPVDELAVLRALRNDPPVYPPVARRLRSYDAKPVSDEQFGFRKRADVAQPWVPRPARRAA